MRRIDPVPMIDRVRREPTPMSIGEPGIEFKAASDRR
jgi:hypothetical protein